MSGTIPPDHRAYLLVAWPVSDDIEVGTLRDYFAGQALAGMYADPSCDFYGPNFRVVAEHAYAAADAMLAEREDRARHRNRQ